jgi:hypothetical protein
MVSAPRWVIGRLVILNGRVLHLALSSARGFGQGQCNRCIAVVSGWPSPRGLLGVSKLPWLWLFGRSQLVELIMGVVPECNVGLLVNLSSGLRELISSGKPCRSVLLTHGWTGVSNCCLSIHHSRQRQLVGSSGCWWLVPVCT